MALCTSCGNQVEESASFCTSCGKPMPAAAHPSAAVSVARPVCSSCGAQGDPDSLFCTECGKRLDAEPEPVAEAAPAVAATAPLAVETAAQQFHQILFVHRVEPSSSPEPAFVRIADSQCCRINQQFPNQRRTLRQRLQRSKLRSRFALNLSLRQRQRRPTRDAIATEPVVATPAPSRVESTPAAVAATPVVEDRPVVAVPSQTSSR